jgi:hypothetical protein
MKQKYLLLALILLSISACSTVKFETSQPKDAEELNEFPPDMIGKYTSMNKDTLIINNNSFQYLEASIFGPGKVNLLKHDEVVLKKSDDNLLLSIKDSNVWEVLLIKHKGSKLTLSCIFYDKKNVNDIINSVKAITNVTAIKDREGNIDKYMINPSKEEFQLLLDKKIFSKIMEYKMIK